MPDEMIEMARMLEARFFGLEAICLVGTNDEFISGIVQAIGRHFSYTIAMVAPPSKELWVFAQGVDDPNEPGKALFMASIDDPACWHLACRAILGCERNRRREIVLQVGPCPGLEE
jgi:hypothetical protein